MGSRSTFNWGALESGVYGALTDFDINPITGLIDNFELTWSNFEDPSARLSDFLEAVESSTSAGDSDSELSRSSTTAAPVTISGDMGGCCLLATYVNGVDFTAEGVASYREYAAGNFGSTTDPVIGDTSLDDGSFYTTFTLDVTYPGETGDWSAPTEVDALLTQYNTSGGTFYVFALRGKRFFTSYPPCGTRGTPSTL